MKWPFNLELKKLEIIEKCGNLKNCVRAERRICAGGKFFVKKSPRPLFFSQ